MLRPQQGNMYPFVTHTWNAIKGVCPHLCKYCFMKPFAKRSPYFDGKELKTDLGENNFIFIGSSIDMFADAIPKNWIEEVFDSLQEISRKSLSLSI